MSLRGLGAILVGGMLMSSSTCGNSRDEGKGPPYAQSALQWAIPDPWSGSGEYQGLQRFTAAELNRTHHGHQWGPIRYLGNDVPSTRPDEISVNPIDEYTWGAVAHSQRSGRCYVVVVTQDRNDPRLGGTLYGELPAGTECLGTMATPDSVTSESPLPE